ncbi:MAG: hypothetical protein IJF71_07300 [Clostridia bacterium]|nr:hypothetical protein [Clostridia bacterium]
MKKKLLIALVLTFCAMFTLTACLQLEKVTNLQLVDAPKTTFAVGEATANDLTFTVSVDRGEEKILFHYPEDAAKISLSGFSTEVAGTFTATISYKVSEANVLTYTFEYTVTDGFAGGNGTEETPYLIASADQFMMIPFIETTGYTYYKLTSDINFEGVDATAYQQAMAGYVFNGELNGLKANGVGSYKIMGYNSAYNFTAEGKIYGMGLFGVIGNAAFKNIEIVDANVEAPLAEGAGIIGVGRSKTELEGLSAEDELVFENVTVSGSIAAGENVGALIGRARGYKSITVYNVENNADVTALTSYTAGGAFGSLDNKVTVVANGFTNNGNISAVGYAAGFIGNLNGAKSVTLNNAENNGTITSISSTYPAGALVGASVKNTVANNVANNGTLVVPANYTAEASDAAFVQANMIKKLVVLDAQIVDGYLTVAGSTEGVAYYRASMVADYTCYNAEGKAVSGAGSSLLFAEERIEANVAKTANKQMTAVKGAYNADFQEAFAADMAEEGVAAGYTGTTFVTPASAKGVLLLSKNAKIRWTIVAYNAEGEAVASASVSYTL